MHFSGIKIFRLGACKVRGMVDYLASEKTIIGQYYADITFKSYDAISQKHRGKLSLCVWLLRDSAPVHKSLVAQQAVRDCGLFQLNYPVYSPQLAPNNCYLFRNLKSHLHGSSFQMVNRRKTLKRGLDGRTDNSFLQGINSLPEKWQKCIDVAGDYIEE